MSHRDPLWYKDAILYELHVRAFHDSTGQGHGDFRGLAQKLDYLQDLGITAVWLLPFYPSPLKDDGYDIADYNRIHPLYGNLEDFQAFLEAAHDRNIRVITELVINHTADQHPWFQRARRAPAGSPERDFYVWSDTPGKYAGARIIFRDFERSNWTLDPVAGAYFWHRFYSHQPDLNFDNPAVWDAIFPVLDFWFEMGVDGLRLDAIPYLYEREGTDCENLPETHTFLKALRAHMDRRFPDRMLLAEANQWPEDAVAYFGEGDECHMAFHFPLMPRLFMAVHEENRFPIHDIMDQTPAIPENCQWCLFLRNHDELTLEMVTDEERDYMYRAYTQDRTARINLGIRHRLAPLLRNDRRRIELMYALLFSLPGTPVIYYGDEIGMGDNIYLGDRNGVRTPMQWSSDRNAGFSRANPQRLYLPVIIDPEYHYETVNVEAQQGNPSSLLWWVKRLIALRKRFRAFARGTLEFLRPDNPKVLAFIRALDGERILVVANLSRFVQYVQLDLKALAGVIPEEILGHSPFPRITDQPYPLTLGPHGFIWFSLPEASAAAIASTPAGGLAGEVAEVELPWLPGKMTMARRFRPSGWDDLEEVLPSYLARSRPGLDAANVRSLRVVHAAPVQVGDAEVWFVVIQTELTDADPETLSLALTFVPEDRVGTLLAPLPLCAVARVATPEPGILCDSLAVPECCRGLLRGILGGRSRRVEDGEIVATPAGNPREIDPDELNGLTLSLRRSERGAWSAVFGESYILKVFRRIQDGTNPDLEIGRYLANHPEFQGAAPVFGSIEYRRSGSEPFTLGVLHGFVANHGTAWQFTLDQLSQYFERVAALSVESPPVPPMPISALPTSDAGPGQTGTEAGVAPSGTEETGAEPGTTNGAHGWRELVGGYLDAARRLAERTAEMHRTLAADRSDPAFSPEPYSRQYQRSLYQALRTLTGRLCDRLAREQAGLSEDARGLAARVVERRREILRRFERIQDPSLHCYRIRCHGDYHLGQLLYTGKDFVIVDFEGEPTMTIGERRVKRTPLRDVASMIRSFDYAAQGTLLGVPDSRGQSPGTIREEDIPALERWGTVWYEQVSREFAGAYVRLMEGSGLLPSDSTARSSLLEMLLLEAALREVDAELTMRPHLAIIPLRSVVRLLGNDPDDPRLLI